MTTAPTHASARAFWMDAPGTAGIREFGLPEIGSNDGLLRVEAAGVCGTDHSIWGGSFGGRMSLPLIPGHEIVGIVEAVGDEAAARWKIQPGDRVALDSFLACGGCGPCLLGDTRYCETLGDYGISMSSAPAPHLYGGFAQYVYLAPGAQVFKLAPDMPPEVGVLVPAVVSNALRWVSGAGEVSPGSSVLISGPGPIGLAGVAVAKAAGAAQVVIAGLPSDTRRLDLARKLGADHVVVVGPELDAELRDLSGGEGFDSVVDVSGSVKSLLTSLAHVRRQGILVAAGLAGASAVAEIPIDRLVLREVTLRGQFSHDRASLLAAMRFVESSSIDWSEFITHRFPLDRTEEAIAITAAGDPTLIKVVVDPWGE